MELKYLKDPKNFTESLFVKHFNKDFLFDSLHKMILIREVEKAIADLVTAGIAKTPCHLAVGQEAIPVGISKNLHCQDRVFGSHRSHGHFLALGSPIIGLIAEVLGKVSGVSKGMGGSMHLIDLPRGFNGSVPIVGGTIPIAVGAALAEKMNQKGNIAVVYFGDGACEEGVFHESLNFASLHKLPILFVCENNLFSSHLDINLRQPKDSMSRFAIANDIEYRLVDGNNVCEITTASSELISRCRNGLGPGFLEAVTYRWLGHVGPREDIDVGVQRSMKDIVAWKKRDPILRLFKGLENEEMFTETDLTNLTTKIKDEVAYAVNLAKLHPYPEKAQLDQLLFSPD